MAKGLTASKAKKILEDGTVRGRALTEKQKKFFGAVAGGATPLKKLNGGWLDKFAMGGSLPGASGMMYARTSGTSPEEPKKAQHGKSKDFYIEPIDPTIYDYDPDPGFYIDVPDLPRDYDPGFYIDVPFDSLYTPKFHPKYPFVQLLKSKTPKKAQDGRAMLSQYEEPAWYEKALDYVASPMTTLGYLARGEELPDRLPINVPKRSEYDNWIFDTINPAAYVKYGASALRNLDKGEYLDAAFDALGAIPVVPAWLSRGKKAKAVIKKGKDIETAPLRELFTQPDIYPTSSPLPKNMEPYLSRKVYPFNKEQEIFESFLPIDTQIKNIDLKSIRYDADGNIIPNKEYGGEIDKAQFGRLLKAAKNLYKRLQRIDNSTGNNIEYVYKNEKGEDVAKFSGVRKGDAIEVKGIQVSEPYRRQGIAQNIYEEVGKESPLMSRSSQQQFTSRDESGRAIAPANLLWEKLVQEGKAEKLKQGVDYLYKTKLQDGGRCWPGYKAVPGKTPFSKGSCQKAEDGGWLDKFQEGGVIEDDRGQWAYPGEITKINSNNITMKGVNYPVLGISDTGDKKMMQPGKDYKFKGNSVTEFPMAQKGMNVEGQKQKKWFDSYIRSDKYLERLGKEFPEMNADELANERWARLMNMRSTPIGFLPESSDISPTPDSTQGTYNADEYPGKIMLRPEYSEGRQGPWSYNTIPLHELGHAVDEGGERIPQTTLDFLMPKLKQNPYDIPKETFYYTRPTEYINRLQPLRYLLQEEGIYDAKKKDFTKEDLQKAKENTRIKYNRHFKDLMENTESEKDFIEIMNTIAARPQMQQDTMVAKDGKSLVELNQLTNFTNYNTPQPGGWLDKYH